VAFGLFWRCVFADESLGAPTVRRDGTVDRRSRPLGDTLDAGFVFL